MLRVQRFSIKVLWLKGFIPLQTAKQASMMLVPIFQKLLLETARNRIELAVM